MKSYDVLESPVGKRVVIKRGWSWPAFLFGAIWMLVKRLWGLLAFVVVIYYVLSSVALSGDDAELISSLLLIAMNVVYGLKGNAWRYSNTLKRGYEVVATVEAHTAEGAESTYLKNTAAAGLNVA